MVLLHEVLAGLPGAVWMEQAYLRGLSVRVTLVGRSWWGNRTGKRSVVPIETA